MIMASITEKLKNVILGFVLVIVLFQVAAELLPEAQSAGNLINDTGISLASLLASDGVLWVIFVVGLFLVGLAFAFGIFGKKK
jgi:hypothetical protein